MEDTTTNTKPAKATISRLVTLTNGTQSKLLKVDRIDTCSVANILKEGKNKFRKKFQQIIYKSSDGEQQAVRSDEDLRLLLKEHDEGPLTLLLSTATSTVNDVNDTPHSPSSLVVTKGSRGVSFIIANTLSIEPEAESQLKAASHLQGCIFALGMPDLHPGKGIPIGAVVMTHENIAYPQLVDNDIGCGMSFIETSLTRDKFNINRLSKLAKSLQSIDGPFGSSAEESCAEELQWGSKLLPPLPELPDQYHYSNLGTIGGGNHFAELQQFEEIFDADAIERHGINVQKIHLLVHSGSRSLGAFYLREFCDKAMNDDTGAVPQGGGHYGVATDSTLFQEYYQNHEIALNYAARNRHLIARRLLEQITPDESESESEALRCKIDIYHNYMEKMELSSCEHDAMKEMAASQGQYPSHFATTTAKNDMDLEKKATTGWIHRKGATPTNQSKVLVIPGSRGTHSYLVEVNQSASYGSGYSVAHGAGRCMNRSKALQKHKNQFPNARQLLQTNLGSVVICDKKDLVYEEAPASYKDIDEVVKCLSEGVVDKEGHGIVRILATLRPLLTYKYKDPYK